MFENRGHKIQLQLLPDRKKAGGDGVWVIKGSHDFPDWSYLSFYVVRFAFLFYFLFHVCLLYKAISTTTGL